MIIVQGSARETQRNNEIEKRGSRGEGSRINTCATFRRNPCSIFHALYDPGGLARMKVSKKGIQARTRFHFVETFMQRKKVVCEEYVAQKDRKRKKKKT